MNETTTPNLLPPTLLHNGTIHSTAEPYAEAMVVEDGQVAWLGSDETAERLSSDGLVVQDLDRALVAPAFVGWLQNDAMNGARSSQQQVLRRLDEAAAFGYGTLRLEVQLPAWAMHTEDIVPDSFMVSSYWAGREHAIDTYPVVSLFGLTDPTGAEGLKPLNLLLSLLGDNAELWEEFAPGRHVAVGLNYAEIAENLIGVRTWMAEEGRQLILDVTDADPAAVVEDMTATAEQLRQLKLSPGAATPTVLVNFDSADQAHWEALLNTGAHVVTRRPAHLATALKVGVPVSAAPQEGENPWQLISDHVHADHDAVSVRAAFNAQTRGAYRSLPEQAAQAGNGQSGQLNPGSPATYGVWEVESLAVQTPHSTAAAWSTDTRARTPLLPYLDGVTLPRPAGTVISGRSL